MCKYLSAAGWHFHVLLSEHDESGKRDYGHLAGLAEVHRIPRRKHGRFRLFLNRICSRFVPPAVPFADRQAMLDTGRRVIRERDIELVVASSYTTWPLPLAGQLARESGLPLLVDLRDIQEQWPDKGVWYRLQRGMHLRHLLKCRNRVLREAAAVTTVSEWHQKTLSAFNSRTELIFNGFDPELFRPEPPRASRVFKIVYAGTIGALSFRDPELLFAACARLVKAGIISPDKFKIQFYSENGAERLLEELLLRYPIREYLDFPGYVSPQEVPGVVGDAQILLLLANRGKGGNPTGIMSTKLFEYLAVNRPLLLVRSDEDCLELEIRRTRAGAACRTVEEVQEFLEKHYRYWQENGCTVGSTDLAACDKYSRRTQADQFAVLFEALIAGRSLK